jgi:hypothetical protein
MRMAESNNPNSLPTYAAELLLVGAVAVMVAVLLLRKDADFPVAL